MGKRVQSAGWTVCAHDGKMFAVFPDTIVVLSEYAEGDNVYAKLRDVRKQQTPRPVLAGENVKLITPAGSTKLTYVATKALSRGDVLCVHDPQSTTVRSAWAPKVQNFDIYGAAQQHEYTVLTVNALG
jgi:hypothetical protein